MSALDLLTTGSTSTLVLLAARMGGLLLVAPVFASRTVPVMVRASLLVVLSWMLFPVAVSVGGAAPEISPATAFSETLVGFAIGLGAAVAVGAAEAMGDLLAVHIGLSGAAALDPLTNQSVPVLGQFANLFAVTVLLSVNAHVLMLDAMAASLRYLPVGAPIDAPRGLAAMVSSASMLFVLGLRFAAPVLAAVLLANVALAVLSRIAPQLNVLSVAFPVQIGLGLLALAASIPLISVFFSGWAGFYDASLTQLLGALAGGGGR